MKLTLGGAEAEVIAKASEFMLENTAFIKSAPAGVKTTIQNAIKNFAKKVREVFAMIAGGNRETRALRELKDGMYRYVDNLQKLWDVAAEEMVNGEQGAETVPVEDVQFSLREVDGQQVVWVDENILASKPESMSAHKFIRNYLIDHIDDVYTIIESGSKVHSAKQLPQEYLYSREAQSHNKSNRNLFSAKLKIVPGIGEMVEIATNRRWEKTKHIHNKNAKYGVYRYDTRVAFESNGVAEAYTAELVILNADDGKKYLYDIVNIKKDDITAKRLMVKARLGGETAQQTNAVTDSVLQTAESVNSEHQFALRDDQTQTEEFKRWFGNSQVVNEDGSPKVMYHGTPYGGFTVFKGWQYFTDDKEYAGKYHNPSASSIRGRYQPATSEQTYEVYLSVKKPFDTHIPEVREIWENEFYGHYSRTPLSERGVPDWTDGIDLVEFIEDNEYDFDGIILDEGGVGGYGDEVKDRGLSVVVRNSNQIKDASPVTYDDAGEVIPLSERFDTGKQDIRFSLRDSNGNDVVLQAKELEENKKRVAGMKPVIELTGNNFSTNYYEKALNYYKTGNDVAENPVLGAVHIEESGLEHLMDYLSYRKTALIPAIKKVIENGEIVHYEPTHKSKPWGTAIIAGKVILDGKDYYMGVSVRHLANQDTRYYIYDAILVDSKKTTTPIKNAGDNAVTAQSDSPSIYSILLSIRKYNPSGKKFALRDGMTTADVRDRHGLLWDHTNEAQSAVCVQKRRALPFLQRPLPLKIISSGDTAMTFL